MFPDYITRITVIRSRWAPLVTDYGGLIGQLNGEGGGGVQRSGDGWWRSLTNQS